MSKQPISTFLGIAAAAVLVSSSYAADIFVNCTCGDNAWSGLTDVCIAPDGPKATIQAGITVANPGDVVIVAEGECFENINFFGKAITVRSTDPNDPVVVMHTIINGGGAGSVVTCDSGEGSGTVLSGFVITGGNSVSTGGGMHIVGSSPTVSNCTFSGNSAIVGGGMWNDNSSPTVSNCTFSGNSADAGGGMRNSNGSNPTVTNCTFIGNTATGVGGGMYNTASSPTVTNCTFSGNSATSLGGGMFNLNNSSPTVSNCTFSGNSAGVGGGMWNDNSSPTVSNTGFCDNTPDQINGGFTDGGGNSLLYCAPPIPKPNPCPTDINDDGVTNVLDLIDVLLAFGQACP